jgi:hypothetical protein
MLSIDAFDALAIALQQGPGTYALLVGSGLSRAAGIPTGWEITLELIRKLAAVGGVTEEHDWAAWHQEKFGKPPNYSELLDALAATPSERRAIVQGFIEGQEGDGPRQPTKAHRAIANLVQNGTIRVIVTPNFDRLLESAIRDVGVEPTVITNEHSLKGALPLVHSRCTILKLHGDYMDARILNTDVELASYPPAIDAYLDQVFDEFGLLVVGWSGEWDLALRDALMRAPSRRYSTYWASRGEPTSLAADVISHRSARKLVIPDAETFLPRLSDTVDALARSAQPHPVSVASGLVRAKRYCRDISFNAEWAEFLSAECAKVRSYVLGPDFPLEHPTPQLEAEAVAEIVGRTELIRRAIMICARWGTPEANSQAIRAVRSLASGPRPRSSFTRWIELAHMPASLCFYWGVAGALDRGDLALAGSFMTPMVPRPFGDSTRRLVAVLPLESSSEGPNWKSLAGVDVVHAASVWLARLFAKEVGDIAVLPDEVDDLFERVEFLIAAEGAVERLDVAKKGQWHFWTYPGTFLFNRTRPLATRIADMIESAKTGPLAGAGLRISQPDVAEEVGQHMAEFFKQYWPY